MGDAIRLLLKIVSRPPQVGGLPQEIAPYEAAAECDLKKNKIPFTLLMTVCAMLPPAGD